MAKRKVSFVESGETSSKRSSEKRSKANEDEATSSKGGKDIKVTSKEKELLKNDKAESYYRKDIGHREIELGRTVDFEWLATEDDLNVDTWLSIQGWTDFLKVNEGVYPRLIRILFANLNPYEMRSCIGNITIRLDEDAWCGTFNIPKVTPNLEAQVRSISKEDLFHDLTDKTGQGVRTWINVNELPKEPSIRLAALILQTALIPKKGSREEIKEEEGRVLYALKYGLEYNLAREIVDRIKQARARKSTPLCYAMHLMVIMKNAGVNLKCAGDTEFRELRSTSHINSKTLGRLGFKKDITHWEVMSKKATSSKFSAESHPRPMSTEQEQARQEEGERRDDDRDTMGEESSMPQPSQTPRTKIPNLSHQFQSIQTAITSQIGHLTSYFSEKIDYLAATVHSKLDSMDSKLEDLSIRVKFCETQLSQPSKSHSPIPSKHTSPIHPEPSPQPSSPKATQPSTQQGSPLFSMEELTTPPTQAATQQPTQPEQDIPPPSQTSSQPQEQVASTQPSESSLAIQATTEPLKLPIKVRSKRAVSKTFTKRKPPKS